MGLLIQIGDEIFRRAADARVSVLDHGFLFGDSVYEVVRTHGGHLYQLGAHLSRLRESAARIYLDLGITDEALQAKIEGALEYAQLFGDAYIRMVVTRGVGPLSLDPTVCPEPTHILIVKDLPTWDRRLYTDGLTLCFVRRVRTPFGTVDPDIKTGNYLTNVLALVEARQGGADEALMVNTDGHLAECTTSNLFFVQRGVIYTPTLETGILAGITRADVVRLAGQAGFTLIEGYFHPEDIFSADECFVTSTTRGIMPVKSLDGTGIGDGTRPITSELQRLYALEVNRFIQANS